MTAITKFTSQNVNTTMLLLKDNEYIPPNHEV
jgi:hypothetical protein